ncbi:MAG: hypothetical protein JXR40_03055 [Pontiellaceae bacterium]|nr:hypothetical protein [Pontiellaceae bacterium]
MNIRRSVCMLLVAITALPAASSALYSKVTGIDDVQIRRVLLRPDKDQILAVASKNAVYLGSPDGPFRKILVLKDEELNHLSAVNTNLYAAGSRNCYRIENTAKRIFSANEGETINFIFPHRDRLYIGTSQRLVYADQQLLNWQTLPALASTAVYSMQPAGSNLYIACEDGIYRLDAAGPLQKIFSTRKSSDGLRARCIKADLQQPDHLWLCTNNGLYASIDDGASWQKIYIDGLGSASVNYLAQNPASPETLYLCSDAGLFKIEAATGKSEILYQGISTSKIQWIDFSSTGEIYLATDQGLFKSEPAPAETSAAAININQLLVGEPTIREVQEAALLYNSVHPTKTQKWKKKLKYRALLPKFSVDYDKTIGSSFSQSGHYYATGPYDWGVSLTWDMGDLLWNSYEDDIDNRTKLTTQLRMDILDEVNRLYFERLRLKHEIAQADPASSDTFEKILRLAELTATLDGYTGGLYSAQQISP